MEQTNTTQSETSQSNLPFVDHFRKIRQNPKWLVKLIIFIVLTFVSMALALNITDNTKALKQAGLSQSEIDKQNQFNVATFIEQSIGAIIFGLLITFVIFLVISKIMKSDASAIQIFSATISYSIITVVFTIIVYGIQALFGLTIPETQLDSLNVFDKGNNYLVPFSLSNLLSSYLIFAVYFGTSKLSKKASIIWAVVALVLTIGFGLIGAGMQDSMQSLSGM
ncbi:YIP1 family protein [Staphylococcus warneri]|uniref:YIP1 family protein n=1 Tax=Staphylococcus warneri TaxID=1292 RepID=UPI00066B8EF9|nr:YIP1 family protein [Staphylococcus warneri]MBY6179472.1 YIP1 family protein [Staphylococcaceae bacterium DP2N0-1]RQM98800.1 YIP1 family protein [Staphylococcus warneri]